MEKYGSISVGNPKDNQQGYRCGFWKTSLRGREEFWKCICFILGSDEEISFGKDLCIGDHPLREEFQCIYLLA